MADLGFAGLYVKLKDRARPVQDRLKLIRFAWKSPEVFIPNKEQVLTDILCGLILNQKKNQVSEENVCGVWGCLAEVLHTRRVADQSTSCPLVVLRQYMPQLMTEYLLKAAEERTNGVEAVIRCGQAVMVSQSLSLIFTSKLDTMVQMLSVLCQLLAKPGSQSQDQVKLFVDCTVDRYIKALKTAPNQTQVLKCICDKFLPHFLPLVSSLGDNSVVMKTLSTACLATVFHKDHHKSYEEYLSAQRGTDGEVKLHKKAKGVDHFFSCLRQILDQKSFVSDALRQYLPVIYEGFIKADCYKSGSQLAHLLLVKMCQLVGMVTGGTGPSLEEGVSADEVVSVMSTLLHKVQTLDLYVVQTEESSDGAQTTFYRRCVQLLLENYSARADWYCCLTSLLRMNHTILEPSLKKLLLIGWIQPQQQLSESAAGSLDQFLTELMSTYSKLRQVSKLVSRILEALTVAHGDKTLPLTPHFLSSYGETTQSLPQGVLVEVWKMFVSCIQEHFLEESGQGNFSDVCTLFHHYLMNVKVTDYSITSVTLSAVEDLLVTMETGILAPLLLQHVDRKQVSCHHLLGTLHLCHACGEVMSMLALYKTYRASTLRSTPVGSHPGDLSFLHSYLDKKQWSSLYKKVKKSGEASLLHVWEVLCMQKTRVMLLFKEASDWPAIGSMVESLLVLPGNINEKESQISWSGNPKDVRDDNKLVARWSLLMSNMAAIHGTLSQDYMKTVARVLIETGSTHTKHSNRKEQTLKSVSEQSLSSPWLLESASLLGLIVSAIEQKCSECITGNTSKSPKKRKKYDKVVSSFLSVQSALSDPDTDWFSGINDGTLTQIQTAGTLLSSLLSQQSGDPIHVSHMDFDKLLNLMKLLQKLPLEHIGPCDQIRCLTGLLSVMAMMKTDNDNTSPQSCKCEELWPLCLKLCTVLLETCGTAPVFLIIDLGTYLDWLQNIVQQSSQDPVRFNRCLLLLEMSASCAVRDYHVLEKLPPLVDKLCSQMREAGFPKTPKLGQVLISVLLLQEVTRMLNRAYLNDSKKETCSLVYTQLSLTLLELSPLFIKPSFSLQEGAVLRAFTSMVAANFREDMVKNMFITSLPSLINWCEGSLKLSMKEGTMYNVMSSLYFLLVIARGHTLLASAFSTEQKLLLWEVLIDVLKRLLSTCGSDSLSGVNNSFPVANTANTQSGVEVVNLETEMNGSEESGRHYKENVSANSDKSDKDGQRPGDYSDTPILTVPDIGSQSSESNSPSSIARSVDNLDTSSISQELVPSPAVIVALYKSLAYQGKLETSGVKVTLMLVQTVMATLLTSFPSADFKTIVHSLVNDVHTVTLMQSPQKIQATLFIWRHLLRQEFSDEQTKVIRYAGRNLMVNMQCVLQQLRYNDSVKLVSQVTLPVLHTQNQMLGFGRKFLPPQSAMMALMSCMNAPLHGATYVPVFTALCDILDCLLMQHSQTVFQNIPAYVGCAKRLLLSVVEQSNQDTISHDPLVTKQLLGCAYQVERLFTLMASHKVEFGKVALYVVADYVTAVQKVTLLPAIKRGLVPAVHCMLDLCDKHAVAQLHTILSHGVTEVFKVIYAEYKKFYKYSGKV